MVGTRAGRADSTVMGPGDRLVSGHVRPVPCRWWPRLEPTGRLQGTKPLGGGVKPVPRPPARRSSQRGDHVGANPVDRGQPGSKLHLVCDGSGLPLTAAVTAANVNDTTMLKAVMDDVPPVWTRRGGGALGPPSSTPTRAMTAAPTGAICGGVGSGHGLPGVGWSPRPGLGGTGGRWSGRCRG
jgi:Transposase DDE domain